MHDIIAVQIRTIVPKGRYDNWRFFGIRSKGHKAIIFGSCVALRILLNELARDFATHHTLRGTFSLIVRYPKIVTNKTLLKSVQLL